MLIHLAIISLQSCQNFLKLFSYIHFISTPWMALNELTSGFQITRELIISIQVLEKHFLDIWEFLQMYRGKELILHSTAISAWVWSIPVCTAVLVS